MNSRLNRLFARCAVALLLFPLGAAAAEPARVKDFSQLPGNQWVLIDQEDNSGGKAFARAIYAPGVGRLYLWGIGGKKPARNVYSRYELEALDPQSPGWQPAFPEAAGGKWTAADYPPFRIYGQSGPDGLKYDEGPRLKTVGGYHATNRVWWWDFDGIKRPSPIHTFNQACWDSKRKRVVYYSDGCTFALDPATHSWSDLEAKNHPATCRSVAWGSLCYDPTGDRILLFGGGLGLNPLGGAPTWFYDCQKNTWLRPQLQTEPPLRCTSPIVYDPRTQSMILFGGNNQAAALNDTWVFDCRQNRWEERKPKLSPPPMFDPAVAVLPGGGRVLVCGNDARKIERNNQQRTSAHKETWIYDVAANTWTPVGEPLELAGYRWLTADAADELGTVLLVAFGRERRTYAFRYDRQAKPAELPGAAPGAVAWKYPEQKGSLEEAPPADRAAVKKRLQTLPANQFVDASPPGLLISKTWSTAVMDTDNSQVFYIGGGHSGYSGNDVARYQLKENRWGLDVPPRFPPYLEGTNAGIFGWSYGMMPFSQHTYLWYTYDPLSKTVLYLARPSISDGYQVQLTDDPKDVFTYNSKEHGYASWVYDPAQKKMLKPSFGRPFANNWHTCVLGTPQGVYCTDRNRLYHAQINRDTGDVKWTLVDADYPQPRQEIKYHYEFQPLIYDSQRNRLIQLKGDKNRVDVYARSLAKDGRWEQLETTGTSAIGREAVYLPEHDTVLWLGDKLFAFHCGTREMRQVDVALPKGSYNHECAFLYAPQEKVCVALIPSSFTGPMQTFLFRYEPQ